MMQKIKQFILGFAFLALAIGAPVYADRTWTPPSQAGHAGQFLQTNGSTTLWATPGGGGGTISGSLAENEVGYGSALDTITSDNLFIRDNATKQTFIATNVELIEPSIESTVGLFTGIYQDFLIGAGGFTEYNASPETHFAFNIASIREDGLPNGMIGGGILDSGTSIGVVEAGLYHETHHTPYFSMIAQVTGGGGYRTLIEGNETGLRLRTDDAFLIDASQGFIRLRTSSSATDYWDLPTVAGAEGEVLTAHGDGVAATWEPGGGSAAGNNTNVQFNDGGLFGGSDLFTWDNTLKSFTAQNDFDSSTSPIVFTGVGVDDMTKNNTYSGNYSKLLEVTIDGFQDSITYINGVGTPFIAGNVVTGSVTGAEGTVESDDGSGNMVILITNGIHFGAGDVIDNGSGVTADWDSQVSSVDTFSYTIEGASQATFVVITGTTQILNDSFEIEFASTSGHIYNDEWSFYGVKYQDTQLANRFNVSSAFGGSDAFITGSGYADGSIGLLAFDGLLQTPTNGTIPVPSSGFTRSTTGEVYLYGLERLGSGTYGFNVRLTDGSTTSELAFNNNALVVDVDEQIGFNVGNRTFLDIGSSGYYAILGDVENSGNGNKFTVDDDNGAISTIFSSTYDVARSANSYLHIDGNDATLGDIEGGYGGLGVLRFDADALISYWGDEDGSGTGSIIRLDRLNGIIEGIATSQMLFSSANYSVTVDTEPVFYGNNDQLKVGWTNSGIWELFDKDSMIITWGDVNNDVGGYQFGFNVTTGVFSTSGLLNSFAGATANPSMQVENTGSITITDDVAGLYFDPASLVAAATITLPANPVNGQEVSILFGGTITTGTVITVLTIAPNSGQTIVGTLPTTATVDTSMKYKYRTATTQWYRVD